MVAELLNVDKGVTALLGGGGKTTLLYALADELCSLGTVILCTSTHIRVPEQYPLVTGGAAELTAAVAEYGAVCAGTPAENGKLTAPELSFAQLAALADYVLVEADGSRGLPLKAHATHEPVIPANTGNVILVVGADGFGEPVSRVCHRPERWAELAGCGTADLVTPEREARVILAEDLGDRVYINKVETAAQRAAAEELSSYLACHVAAGSLHKGVFACLR